MENTGGDVEVLVNTGEEEVSSSAPSLHTLCLRYHKRSLDLFQGNIQSNGIGIPSNDIKSLQMKLSTKINDDYGTVKDLPPPPSNPQKKSKKYTNYKV